MERTQKNDIVSAMIFEKEEAAFVLSAFDFTIKEKGVDLEAKENLVLKVLRAKIKCMHSTSEHIADVRNLECELLGYDKVDVY